MTCQQIYLVNTSLINYQTTMKHMEYIKTGPKAKGSGLVILHWWPMACRPSLPICMLNRTRGTQAMTYNLVQIGWVCCDL